MTQAKTRFNSFEEYLAATESLPEGLYEYWDGELLSLITESGDNDQIDNTGSHLDSATRVVGLLNISASGRF